MRERRVFHTSHPGLCAALRRTRGWAQCSSVLFGGDKTKSARSIIKSLGTAAGSGGHFRAVQGWSKDGTKHGAKSVDTPSPPLSKATQFLWAKQKLR